MFKKILLSLLLWFITSPVYAMNSLAEQEAKAKIEEIKEKNDFLEEGISMLQSHYGQNEVNISSLDQDFNMNILENKNTQLLNFIMNYNESAKYYISEGISSPQEGAWTHKNGMQYLFPSNVPIISTYSILSDSTLWPILSLYKRVGNTLMYLVVQDKLERSLEAINAPKTQSWDQASRDNVTVKYHPLIADGIKTGVGGTTNKILKGDFILMDREQKVLRSRKMTVKCV